MGASVTRPCTRKDCECEDWQGVRLFIEPEVCCATCQHSLYDHPEPS